MLLLALLLTPTTDAPARRAPLSDRAHARKGPLSNRAPAGPGLRQGLTRKGPLSDRAPAGPGLRQGLTRKGPVVAVFDIDKSGDPLGARERERLSLYLSARMAQAGYRVVPRGQLLRRLRREKRRSYRECVDEACQIQIGKELAASKSLSTHLLQIGGKCVLTLSLYDLKTAASERAADVAGTCDPTGVTRSIATAVTELARAPGPKSGAPDGGIRVSNFGFMQASVKGRAVVLPHKRTDVQADVVGVMSSVKVTQEFRNPLAHPVEATYAFPLPHRAAVHAMTMHVGRRRIRAQIQRRAAARAAYKRAKREGRTAALLEQERPNLFTQSVANIMPGDTIRVELRYVEELVPERGRYSFVFPMTVGPRYVRAGAGERVTQPVLARGIRPGRDVSLSLSINAALPLAELKVLTHRARIERPGRGRATIALDPADRIPNRDFVASFALTGARPQATVLADHHDQRGGHLLLLIQPPKRVAPAQVAPREFVFVVDTSGSMHGRPLNQAKRAMELCLASLGPADRFQIIRFASDAEPLASRPLPPTAANRARARRFLNDPWGSGGTEFLPALKLALGAAPDPRRARVVVFMSDGFIGYEAEVLRFIRANLGAANLFAFGIGDSVNRFLINSMARLGQGQPYVLLSRVNERAVIRRFFETVSRPALTGIRVDWGGLDVRAQTPSRPPDLFANKPIVLAARYSRGGQGVVTVRGHLAGAPFVQRIPVTLPTHNGSASSPALAYLWARRRIGELMDLHRTAADDSARRPLQAQVTELALGYELMSKFTSFVALDEVVRNPGGTGRKVLVPQILPDGVSERAAAGRTVAGALSVDQFVPGDPEVTITAPPDALRVTLVFPTGEVKACVKDPTSGKWQASFLIPRETPDGIYTIRVLIALRSGRQLVRRIRYQVDGTAPRVAVELKPARAAPGAQVTLVVRPLQLGSALPRGLEVSDGALELGDPTFSARVLQDIARAEARLPAGARTTLTRQPDGSFAASFRAPRRPGRHAVIVVVRDHAHNKVRRMLWLDVSR